MIPIIDKEYEDFDALKVYLNEINKIPLLTREEEVKLGEKLLKYREIKDSDKYAEYEFNKARDALVKANLRFVVSLAKKYYNGTIPLLDLIQYGNIGLTHAPKLFDVRKGFHFISYARWWILHEILIGIGNNESIIRIPINKLPKFHAFIENCNKLAPDSNFPPSYEDIQELMPDLSQEYYKIFSEYFIHTKPKYLHVTLDSHTAESDTLEMYIESPYEPPEHLIEEKTLYNILMDQLNTLGEMKKNVIIYRFGLDGNPPQPLRSIGEHYSLTKERIRQIEKDILENLRNKRVLKELHKEYT